MFGLYFEMYYICSQEISIMTLTELQKRQDELTPLMIENSNFGLLRAKKDPMAEVLERKYYELQAEFNFNRILINKILDSQTEVKAKNQEAIKKEPREITSTTYIMAQTKFSNDFDRYFKR